MQLKEVREKETDYESFRAQISILGQKIEERDREIDDALRDSSEREKQRFIQDKIEKETFQNKIEELSTSLKNVQLEYRNYAEKTQNEIHKF
jgi:exoribonuclease R